MKRVLFVGLALALTFSIGTVAAAQSPDISFRGGAWLADVTEKGDIESEQYDSTNTHVGTLELTMDAIGSGIGFYVGGEADLGDLGLSGFYGTVEGSNPEVTVNMTLLDPNGEQIDEMTDSTTDVPPMKASTYHVLAGYDVGPVTLGGGWASVSESVKGEAGGIEWDNETSGSGFALGGYGSYPVANDFTVSGYGLYAPSVDATATIANPDGTYSKSERKGSILGLEARATYQATENVSIEAGYRLARLAADPKTETTEPDPTTGNYTKTTDESSISIGGFFVGSTVRF